MTDYEQAMLKEMHLIRLLIQQLVGNIEEKLGYSEERVETSEPRK